MVGGEREPQGVGGVFAGVPGDVAREAVGIGTALGYVVEQMVQLPGVGRVEAGLVQPGLLAFGKEVEVAVFAAELADNVGPEVLRHQRGHVAAEAVDSAVEPEAHALLHLGAHLGVVVVELGDVGPVIFDYGPALLVAHIPRRVLLRHPGVVGRGVVRDPVYDEPESEFVRLREEGVEVRERAEFGVDVAVVAYGVIGAERALAVELAYGVGRHDPENVDSEFLEYGQPFGRGGEGSLGGHLSDVEFIDHGAALVAGGLRSGLPAA